MSPIVRFIFAALLFLGSLVAHNAKAENAPNVILIMADDVSWECFGCYGAEDYKTPRIDELAAKGIRFSHCYSQPLCTPSRVQIMTGKYNFRNYTHFGYLDPNEKTFGHLMQDAGYATAIAGKWQLNGLYDDLPRSQDSKRPLEAGFDETLLWQVTQGKKDKGGGERFWNPMLEHNGKSISSTQNEGQYGPDLFTDFVCDFIERKQDQPFFVYYPMVLVHDPFVRTPETIGDQDRGAANKEPKEKDAKKANFVAMVQYMDRLVGRIIDQVDSLGLSEETLILFTADNGTHRKIRSRWNGVEIAGGKGGMTDMGTHVPMVAYWQGKTPEGTVVEDLIDFTDVYPTLAQMAGVKLSDKDPSDGRGFQPQLLGKPGDKRSFVLCHYHPHWGQPHGQFVRNQNYKLYGDGRAYDIATDLQESNDIAIESRMNPQRAYFEKVLSSLPPVPANAKQDKEVERSFFPDWSFQTGASKIFLIGNSLTWDTRPEWLDGDIRFHVDCGKPLPYIAANPESPCVKSSTLWPEALTRRQYDFVSVQPHGGSTLGEDIETIGKWMQMQRSAEFVIHSGWARHAVLKSEYEDARFDAPNSSLNEVLTHSPGYIDTLIRHLTKQFPNRKFRQTHATETLNKIASDIVAGDAPFEAIEDLYRDKVHMTLDSGRYLMHNVMRLTLGQPVSAQHFPKLDPEIKSYLDRVLEWHQDQF